MKKIKNTLAVIIPIICFIGVMVLLMLWDDGLFDGTLFSKILSIALPSLLGAYSIMLLASFWVFTVFKGYAPLGIIFLVSFVLLAVFIIFLSNEILYTIATVIFVLVVISLIVFWVRKLFDLEG